MPAASTLEQDSSKMAHGRAAAREARGRQLKNARWVWERGAERAERHAPAPDAASGGLHERKRVPMSRTPPESCARSRSSSASWRSCRCARQPPLCTTAPHPQARHPRTAGKARDAAPPAPELCSLAGAGGWILRHRIRPAALVQPPEPSPSS